MAGNKPPWIRSEYRRGDIEAMETLMSGLSLNTVCREANCPNRGECFRHHTATFMILGSNCTRRCRFCNVQHGPVAPPDPDEPRHIVQAVLKLQLKHAVITSVTRDDLADGGAAHFAATVNAIHAEAPGVSVELLISDLKGDLEALKTILDARPEVLGHNLETVPRLYPVVRPQTDYRRSMDLLAAAKAYSPRTVVKTGIMVGLGETPDEVAQLMREAAEHCDALTVGQYLRPSPEHLPVAEYVTPEQFERYAELARSFGFASVMSGPMVRSSYHAAEMLRSGGEK